MMLNHLSYVIYLVLLTQLKILKDILDQKIFQEIIHLHHINLLFFKKYLLKFVSMVIQVSIFQVENVQCFRDSKKQYRRVMIKMSIHLLHFIYSMTPSLPFSIVQFVELLNVVKEQLTMVTVSNNKT